MTVSTTLNKITYQGNGGTTVFPFSFPGVAANDIEVFFTDALGNITTLAPTAYTLALNAPSGANPTGAGGSVTYNPGGTPIALGTSLTIFRSLTPTQTTSLANQGTLWQPVIEEAIDFQTMLTQQALELFGRGITVAVSDPAPASLPPVAQRAGLFCAFDNAGNPIAAAGGGASTPVSSAMAPVVAAASIAAAQALLGIGSFPAGIELDWPGLGGAPAGWFLEDGQAVSRAGNPNLLAAIAPTYNCVITSGSATITGISSTLNWPIGMPLESVGFAPGTTVSNILSGTSVSASGNATGNAGQMQIFPFGNGNGASTFNVPDARGVVYAGITTMGGSLGSYAITVAGGNFDGTQMGANGGAQNLALSITQLPSSGYTLTMNSYTPTGGIASTDLSTVIATIGGNNDEGAKGAAAGISGATLTFVGNAAILTGSVTVSGGGQTHINMQPTSMRYKIIKGG
jgi:microcystin-dependent protein